MVVRTLDMRELGLTTLGRGWG